MMARLALVATLAGCTAAATPSPRFANAPPVTRVDDRRDVPRRPAVREHSRQLYHFDGSFHRLVTRLLELPRPRRALGVNALDEVPDSTWFTNRIGVRALSLDELRTGAAVTGSPEPHKPWTVHSTKVGGLSVGFIISDARGVKFLLKFDRPRHPEVETATEVIASKLLWAAGYNVAEAHIVHLRPGDLAIAPDAVVKDWSGVRGKLERSGLERRLAQVAVEPDGRIRAMASRMLDGKFLGGHAGEGLRADDPNDRIPHELRRDLRGAYALFSWLDHTDVKEDNTLDMWTADGSRHYVMHYLIDFGSSLGAAALFGSDLREGHVYQVDFPDMFESLATLGLRPRLWERRVAPGLRGIGLYDAATYDPGAWKPETPAYLPLRTADDRDKAWGARILLRFTREQLRAVVETARLSDPRAVEHLVDTLVARQRATARYWLARTSALDRIEVTASRTLCFDDLVLTHQLAPVGPATRYRLLSHDQRGRVLARLTAAPSADGRTCAGPLAVAPDRDGYTIVRIDTSRLGVTTTVFVHLARGPDGALRVIGIWRA